MSTTTPKANKGHYGGEPFMWILLLGDIVMYSLFLLFYGHDYQQQTELFRQSQTHLNTGFGFFNTLVLLTGSWLVVKGVTAAAESNQTNRQQAGRYFLYALLSGLIFGISKTAEYTIKVNAGIDITTNSFYTYYFALTGFHLIHVVIGMGALFYMRRHVLISDHPNQSFLESGANFWHLVDMLWLLIFPIIYLV